MHTNLYTQRQVMIQKNPKGQVKTLPLGILSFTISSIWLSFYFCL